MTALDRDVIYLLARVRSECERQTEILLQLQTLLIALQTARPPTTEGILSKVTTSDIVKLALAAAVLAASFSGRLDLLAGIANFAR